MNYVEDLILLIGKLSNIYERYIDLHNNVKLDLIIEDRKISLKLYDENEILDEFALEFNKFQNKIYKYISVKTIILLLGNMIIHNDDNKFYNNIHKPYLNVIVNDSEIYEILMQLISNQEEKVINNENDIVNNLKVKPIGLFYPFRFMATVDLRVDITDKLLKKVKI